MLKEDEPESFAMGLSPVDMETQTQSLVAAVPRAGVSELPLAVSELIIEPKRDAEAEDDPITSFSRSAEEPDDASDLATGATNPDVVDETIIENDPESEDEVPVHARQPPTEILRTVNPPLVSESQVEESLEEIDDDELPSSSERSDSPDLGDELDNARILETDESEEESNGEGSSGPLYNNFLAPLQDCSTLPEDQTAAQGVDEDSKDDDPETASDEDEVHSLVIPSTPPMTPALPLSAPPTTPSRKRSMDAELDLTPHKRQRSFVIQQEDVEPAAVNLASSFIASLQPGASASKSRSNSQQAVLLQSPPESPTKRARTPTPTPTLARSSSAFSSSSARLRKVEIELPTMQEVRAKRAAAAAAATASDDASSSVSSANSSRSAPAAPLAKPVHIAVARTASMPVSGPTTPRRPLKRTRSVSKMQQEAMEEVEGEAASPSEAVPPKRQRSSLARLRGVEVSSPLPNVSVAISENDNPPSDDSVVSATDYPPSSGRRGPSLPSLGDTVLSPALVKVQTLPTDDNPGSGTW